jgi:hypothetical protein
VARPTTGKRRVSRRWVFEAPWSDCSATGAWPPRYDRTATTVYVLTGVAAADMVGGSAIRRSYGGGGICGQSCARAPTRRLVEPNALPYRDGAQHSGAVTDDHLYVAGDVERVGLTSGTSATDGRPPRGRASRR